jgi:6-phosphogluconolactonase (cycloisomerase 2 family)
MSSDLIWVGGYTDDMSGAARGINLLTVAPDGSLENHGLAAASDSPSYLASSGDVLYAAGEGGPNVLAFRIVGDELHFVGIQGAAGGSPCAIAVVGDRRLLVAACYEDGVIDVHPLRPDGAIGRTSQSLRGDEPGPHVNQDGPHAHAALQVNSTTVATTDLGTDRVYLHALERDGLTRTGVVQFPAGTGPRDLLLHPSGALWVLTELSAEIFVLRPTESGYEIATSVILPGAQPGDHASALARSRDGRFVYSGLRGSDRIAILAVSGGGQQLAPVGFVDCGGGWPRHLVVDGDYLRVANQLTDSVATFAIGDDGIPVLKSSLTVPSPTYLLLG